MGLPLEGGFTQKVPLQHHSVLVAATYMYMHMYHVLCAVPILGQRGSIQREALSCAHVVVGAMSPAYMHTVRDAYMCSNIAGSL